LSSQGFFLILIIKIGILKLTVLICINIMLLSGIIFI